MLLESCYLGIDSFYGSARIGCQPDAPSIPFQSPIDKSGCHASNVSSGFRIRESLVSRGLLQTIGILRGREERKKKIFNKTVIK